MNASNLPAFRPVYDLLSRMACYKLSVERMRDLQPAGPGDMLARDGSIVASVLRRIGEQDPETKLRIEEYLANITDGIRRVDTISIGSKEMLRFEQRRPGQARIRGVIACRGRVAARQIRPG